MLVGESLVSFVVGISRVAPALVSEEVVGPLGHLLELLVGLSAVHHRLTEELLGTGNLEVSAIVVLLAVLLVGTGQLGVELVDLNGAVEQVVASVCLLLGVRVEETSRPLRGVTVLQIDDVEGALLLIVLEKAGE